MNGIRARNAQDNNITPEPLIDVQPCSFWNGCVKERSSSSTTVVLVVVCIGTTAQLASIEV